MKRVILQEAALASSQRLDSAVVAAASAQKQGLPGGNRRARTSAAMLGLALSMGASGVVITGDQDSASAKEVQSSQPIVATLPKTTAQDLVAAAADVGRRHTVREGETLWDIAQSYGVDALALVSANGFTTDVVLQVGQTLSIPDTADVAISEPVALAPTAYPPVELSRPDGMPEASSQAVLSGMGGTLATLAEKDAELKALQAESVAALKKDAEQLKLQLAELRQARAESGDGEMLADDTIAIEKALQAKLAELEEAEAVLAATEATPASESPELIAAAPVAAPATVDAVDAEAAVDAGLDPVESPVTTVAVAPSSEPAIAPEASVAEPELSEPSAVDVAPEAPASVDVALGTPPVEVAEASASSLTVTAEVQELPSVIPSEQLREPDAAGVLTPTDLATRVEPIEVARRDAERSTLPQRQSSPLADTRYQVQPGDTLSAIARRHGISLQSLVAANRIQNPNRIFVGTSLSIPEAQAIAPTTTVRPSVEVAVRGSTPGLLSVQRPDSDAKADLEIGLRNPVLNTASAGVAVDSPNQPFSESLTAPTADREDVVAVAPTVLQPSVASPAGDQVVEDEIPGLSIYAQRLLVEVREMRAQRRQSAPTDVAAAVTLPEESSTRMRDAAALDAEDRSAPVEVAVAPSVTLTLPEVDAPQLQPGAIQVDPVQPQVETTSPRSESTVLPQLLAAAPIGAEQYAPLTQPSAGQMVSPDVPPLPGSEEFLPGDPSSNGYVWPSNGVFTSGYGWRWGRMHRGIDIAAPVGTPVVASASGVVVSSGWNSGGYGNLVEVRHSDGTLTRYAHNNRLLVRPGQRVRQGQQIAEMGSTGYSTGPHVHFEIHPPNQGAVNPMAYLPRR